MKNLHRFPKCLLHADKEAYGQKVQQAILIRVAKKFKNCGRRRRGEAYKPMVILRDMFWRKSWK
jgi:hypothetical protein